MNQTCNQNFFFIFFKRIEVKMFKIILADLQKDLNWQFYMDYISLAIHSDCKSSNIPRATCERVPAWCGCSSWYSDNWGRLSIYLIIALIKSAMLTILVRWYQYCLTPFLKGNVSLPYFLASLLDHFKDRDCPKKHLVLSITKYSSSEVHCMRFMIVIDQITMHYITQLFSFIRL